MTYPPNSSSGYPPGQQPTTQFSAPTQQFGKAEQPSAQAPAATAAGPSKLPFYLLAAAAVLGLLVYVFSFGPMFQIESTDFPQLGSASGTSLGLGLAVVAALLAGLLAGAGLLPRQRASVGVVAALAVLGFLLVIAEIINTPEGVSLGWALYAIILLTLLQAAVAVGALLLDAGIITAPAPKQKYEQQQQYGQYGGPSQYYGQHDYGQHALHQGSPQQQRPGYPSQYGGYPGGSSPGGYQASEESGPPTPPTGFPTYGQPQDPAPLPRAGSRHSRSRRRHRRRRISPATRRHSRRLACVTLARERRANPLVVENRPVGTRQARDLFRVAFGPSVVALVIIAAVVLLQLLIANSDMTGASGAIASMWLGVHQVPVSIGGRELGVMPLLPVLAMVWGTARTTAAATPPQGSWFVIRWIIASALGGPLLIAAISLAVVHDAASVLTELQTPNALRAFAGVLAVHGIGAAIGVGSRAGRRVVAASGMPGWVADAARPAVAGVLALVGLSGAVTALSLVVHWSTMHELYAITDSLFGQFSLTVLSALYAPNVIVGTSAVAVGSSAHVGLATFSSFTVFGGDIPALPVLAAVPTPPLGPVWVALLIVAAASAVVVGQQCARRPLWLLPALGKLVIASAAAAAIMALLGYAGGGQLGNFGHVGVDQATFAPAVFLWFVGIGGLTVAMTGGIARRPKMAKAHVEPVEPVAPVGPVTPVAPVASKLTFGRKSASSSSQNVDLEEHPAPEPGLEPSRSRTLGGVRTRGRARRRGGAGTRRGGGTRAGRARRAGRRRPTRRGRSARPGGPGLHRRGRRHAGPVGEQKRPADD